MSFGEISRKFERAAAGFFAGSPSFVRLARGIARNPDLVAMAETMPRFRPIAYLAVCRFVAWKHGRSDILECTCSVDELHAFMVEHRSEVIAEMSARRSNKTAVQRSAALAYLVRQVAIENRYDRVSLVDVGCAAGVNLFLDMRRNSIDGTGRNISTFPQIVGRIGIDLTAIDLQTEADRQWLLCHVFPEDSAGAEALAAALKVLADERPRILIGDAAEKLGEAIGSMPRGVPIIIMHSFTGLHRDGRFRSAVRASGRSCISIERGKKTCQMRIDSRLVATTTRECDVISPIKPSWLDRIRRLA